jgi:biopolymer transport protein ExbD
VPRNALTVLAFLAACGREPDPAMQVAMLSRLDEIDARITALERRFEAERLEASRHAAPDASKPSETISVHVEAESISFGDDGERLPDEMLSRRLEEAVRDGDPTVLVRADPRISPARMTTILDLIELAGVRSVAIARVSAQSGDTDDAADTPAQ